MILLDASAVVSAIDAAQPQHPEAREALEAESRKILSPFILAEINYLVLRNAGVDAEIAFLEEVARGTYELAAFGPPELAAARAIVARYREHEIGLADASIVVLADRYGTDRVLTLDERHFRVLRTSAGRPFKILPADAPRRERRGGR